MEPNASFTHVHVVVFDTMEEAAAFVAALSRYLSSPSASIHSLGPEPTRVWARRLPGSSGTEVYLTDSALAATTAGFAEPAISGTRTLQEIAVSAIQMIDESTGPLGRDSVLARLTPNARG